MRHEQLAKQIQEMAQHRSSRRKEKEKEKETQHRQQQQLIPLPTIEELAEDDEEFYCYGGIPDDDISILFVSREGMLFVDDDGIKILDGVNFKINFDSDNDEKGV